MVADEIDSFVNHFKFLWSQGYEASMNVESKLGEVMITLSCKARRNELPGTPPPSFFSTPMYRRSPSYYRRQARRKAERDVKIMSFEEASTPVDAPTVQAEAKVVERSAELLAAKAIEENLCKEPLVNNKESENAQVSAEVAEVCTDDDNHDVPNIYDGQGKVGPELVHDIAMVKVDRASTIENEVQDVKQPLERRPLASDLQSSQLQYPLPKLSFLKF